MPRALHSTFIQQGLTICFVTIEQCDPILAEVDLSPPIRAEAGDDIQVFILKETVADVIPAFDNYNRKIVKQSQPNQWVGR
mmetsp:Transcript_15039/g.45925  ORF Transcript_15039/g.45925 Transcript_15039/m.45925 type:complete len:81 (-) Transcript_15039:429-671(-)